MNKMKKQFYLVDLQILPTAIKKTIRAKEMLKNGEADTINAAVVKTGISRSAYYKYKDHVAPALDDAAGDVVTMFLVMQNDPAITSKLFRRLGREKIEIITMNKGIPVKKLTTMTLSIRVSEMQISLQELIGSLQQIKGIKKVYVVGEE